MKVDKLFNLSKKSYEYLNAGKIYTAEEINAAKRFIKSNTTATNAKTYTSPFGLTGTTARSIKAENTISANTLFIEQKKPPMFLNLLFFK